MFISMLCLAGTSPLHIVHGSIDGEILIGTLNVRWLVHSLISLYSCATLINPVTFERSNNQSDKPVTIMARTSHNSHSHEVVAILSACHDKNLHKTKYIQLTIFTRTSRC
jgi:hypothetical protein